MPTILFGVFNGALVSALVPIFSEYFVDRSRRGRLAAGQHADHRADLGGSRSRPRSGRGSRRFTCRGSRASTGRRLDEAIAMTRWLMPCIIATSLSGILAAILNAYHRFAATALQGVRREPADDRVRRGRALHRFGIGALVLGTLAGAFAQLVVQLPPFFALHRFRFVIDWAHPGLRRLLLRARPDRDRLGGGPDRAVLRSLLRLGLERRLDRRDELRGKAGRLSAADLRRPRSRP